MRQGHYKATVKNGQTAYKKGAGERRLREKVKRETQAAKKEKAC